MSRALARYRLMARIVGSALVVLVMVAMPLKYLAGLPVLVEVLGPLHGFLYLAYLLTVIDLARHVCLPVPQLTAMVTAGLIPFLTFVVERRIAERIARPTPAPDVVAASSAEWPAPGR